MSETPDTDGSQADAAGEFSAADAEGGSLEVTPAQVVEALIFGSEVPLTAAKIAQALEVGGVREVRQYVEQLNERYEQSGSAFRIQEIAGGYQMMTLPVYHTWLARLQKARQETRLSAASLETLAIVAYKQPVTRAEIESVRGVSAGEMLNRLREVDLIRIVGRAEDLGRPILYGTTRRFLEVFGLPELSALPKIEGPLFSAGLGGAAPAAGATESAAEQSLPAADDSVTPGETSGQDGDTGKD